MVLVVLGELSPLWPLRVNHGSNPCGRAENDLQDAFAAHGTVVETNLMMDRATGRPRGFGFVTMGTPEEAQKAIDALNGKELGDRALTVNMARPREERSGGGGGRGGFGGRGGGGGRDRD
jgi:cold-inducible RNA-binding protein